MSRRSTAGRGSRRSDGRSSFGAALYGVVATAMRWIPRDLSLTSVSTLDTLDRTGPRRVTDLAAVEGVTQPSMTVLISGLERAGLVERGADPTDKRAALVALTAAGSDYLRARRQANAEAFDELIDKLPTDEVAALTAAIPALVHLRELDDEQRNMATRRTDGRSRPAGL